MLDLPIRAEAVEAAAKAMWGGDDWEAAGRCYPWTPEMEDCRDALEQVRLGIAAFCEAEGLTVERLDFAKYCQVTPPPSGHDWRQRLVGRWRGVGEER